MLKKINTKYFFYFTLIFYIILNIYYVLKVKVSFLERERDHSYRDRDLM